MHNLISSIQNQINYHYNIKKQPSNHIGYGIDNNYVRCAAVSIASLCNNNPQIAFDIHILATKLTSDNLVKLQQLAQNFAINITIYEINPHSLPKLPTKSHLPLPTYFRFILPALLKDITTLIYMDADIVCLQNLQKLFTLTFNENEIIAAVPDLDWMGKKRNHELGLQNHIYFNAGMLVINAAKWNQFNIFDKVVSSLMANPKKFRYLDQDALNLVLTGHIHYLPTIYNCIDQNSLDFNDICLLHFVAHPKPWTIAWDISTQKTIKNKDIYPKYEALTPWKNSPKDMPKNYKEMRIYSQCLWRQHKYIDSLKWYYKYIINKEK